MARAILPIDTLTSSRRNRVDAVAWAARHLMKQPAEYFGQMEKRS
jgi:hypothetical protein